MHCSTFFNCLWSSTNSAVLVTQLILIHTTVLVWRLEGFFHFCTFFSPASPASGRRKLYVYKCGVGRGWLAHASSLPNTVLNWVVQCWKPYWWVRIGTVSNYICQSLWSGCSSAVLASTSHFITRYSCNTTTAGTKVQWGSAVGGMQIGATTSCTAAVLLAAHTVTPRLHVIFTSWTSSGHFLHNRKVSIVMKQTNIALGLYYLDTVHAHTDLRALCEIPSTQTAFQPVHKHKHIGDYSWHMTPWFRHLWLW